MSLEVDGRPGGVPIPHQDNGEGFKFVNGQDTYYNPSHAPEPYTTGTTEGYSQHQQPSKPEGSGQGGRVHPASIFRWWFLFVLVAVLAVVAAGVAGSVAAKRGKHIDTCMQTVQDLNVMLAAASHKSNDTANTTCQNSNSASFIPTTDCTSLASPYTPPSEILGLSTTNNSFNIHCDTDYVDPSETPSVDFMSFVAFTFEDCIVGCASYNQRVPSLHPNSTCYGVSFDNYGGENKEPNCFLKGAQNLAPTSKPGKTSSALLITNR